ncbi:BPSL1445 family SYLF domain-containing lipoprotein [Bordetella genomosp. 13]|uniref:Twin-arginine translocation pathway signal n=1 Tax=Bordetella genomosp. 13 TaxID=463040 RepID=A0A1W6ZFJ4_9BORD|nr:YSC84-related protein [Bordetella genomosp. 13]ARP96042.1 twin-arginine translocation pathway signal [Bordetella genomosp. 13]
MFGSFSLRRTSLAAATVALAGLTFAGCTTNTQQASATPAQQRSSINSAADATLSKLYQSAPQSRELVQRAKGVLVFPDVIGGGFIVAGEYGKGVLRVGGQPVSYYTTAGGSIGFQAGAQSRATVLLFMTDEALKQFRASNGWTVGADANVAIAKIGANGSIDSNTYKQSIVGFQLNNAGLMAGVSIDGSKITRDTSL